MKEKDGAAVGMEEDLYGSLTAPLGYKDWDDGSF
jgi:hypothetical protein